MDHSHHSCPYFHLCFFLLWQVEMSAVKKVNFENLHSGFLVRRVASKADWVRPAPLCVLLCCIPRLCWRSEFLCWNFQLPTLSVPGARRQKMTKTLNCLKQNEVSLWSEHSSAPSAMQPPCITNQIEKEEWHMWKQIPLYIHSYIHYMALW